VSKPWRLTTQAERSLIEIAIWTFETFGTRQAELYEGELIEQCQAISDGHAITHDCKILAGEAAEDDVRFARAGEHFVVFVEFAEEIAILDFLHSKSDLPRRIADLTSRS
jgi:plasmid stabilization system protein ParE